MKREIKCPDCQTWSTNHDYCPNCGALLNAKIKLEQKLAEREEARLSVPKDKVDIFLHRFKHSRWWIIKGVYYLLYSVWLTIMAIVSFFLFIIASAPG